MLNYTHSMLQQLHSLQAYTTHHADAKFESFFIIFHQSSVNNRVTENGDNECITDFQKHKTITSFKTCKNTP